MAEMKILLLCSVLLSSSTVFSLNDNAGEAGNEKSAKIAKLSTRELDNAIPVEVYADDGRVLLRGNLGMSAPSSVGQSESCIPDAGYEVCRGYGDYAKLQIAEDDDRCVRFVWTSTQARKLEDCFDLDSHWYGGTETWYQTWPIEDVTREEAPLVTGWSWDSLVENYWVISSGVALVVDEDVPFFISWGTNHANQVCLSAQDKHPYKKRDVLELKYTICTGANLKDVHERTLRKHYPVPPSGAPDRTMLLHPFWSTWAQYHTGVDQARVIEYAQRVKSEGFVNSSHIEIDDDWENCYGEAQFNTEKFPDVVGMVRTLNELDLKVTLWIHPFINFNCPSFQTAIENSYFVKDEKGSPAMTDWWQGSVSGIIDYTNEAAVAWWKARLEALQTQYNIDSYKFDAGETGYLPRSFRLNGDAALEPNLYSTKYVESVVSFGGMLEVRTGRRNQREPIFTRMLDKDSRWGYDNGLQSLIPTLLLFGVLGYPFVLPDMIGGNAYGGRPSKELYIRWMQANVFMPAVQFSIVPWDYDDETVQICKDVLALRERYQDLIYKAVDQTLVDGSPINRPMWWEDPDDVNTHAIDDQYMLGDDILVAPIVREDAVSRDIYFPRGDWVDSNGVRYVGPGRLPNYPAPLNVVPYFIKSSTLAKLQA